MKVLLSTPTRFAAQIALLTLALLGAANMAAAQRPSQAQASAIRSNCRSDYRSHCASVPTGGARGTAMFAEECREPLAFLPAGRECGWRRRPSCALGVRCAGDATHRSASSVCHRASCVCSASRPRAERSDNAAEQITRARGARSGRRAGGRRHRDTGRRRDFYVLDRPQ